MCVCGVVSPFCAAICTASQASDFYFRLDDACASRACEGVSSVTRRLARSRPPTLLEDSSRVTLRVGACGHWLHVVLELVLRLTPSPC